MKSTRPAPLSAALYHLPPATGSRLRWGRDVGSGGRPQGWMPRVGSKDRWVARRGTGVGASTARGASADVTCALM